jgi:hypothetical protein
MRGIPAESLVSLWRSGTDASREQFLCSGVFVADRLVLTVGHAIDICATPWVRPHVGGAQTFPASAKALRHPELDAALLRLEVMPLGCVAAPLDISGSMHGLGEGMSLNGYFEGRMELAYPARWLSFDSEQRHHLIDVKQPVGQSGSAVANRDRVWGIAVQHYDDYAIHRGCVISLGQLWPDWLDGQLPHPGVGRIAEQTPVYDIAVRAEEIRGHVKRRLEDAMVPLMDFARDFGMDADFDKAVLLSMELRELPDVRTLPVLRRRVQIAAEVLGLVRELVRRSTEGLQ